MSGVKRAALEAGVTAWCLWLLWMLLFRRLDSASALPLGEYVREHLVLVPFRTIAVQTKAALAGDRHAISNLGGNTLLFLPVGWAAPVLVPALRRYGRFLLAFGGAIVLEELAQLFLRVGVCEVDDLLLNCAGASVGFLLWKIRFGKVGFA